MRAIETKYHGATDTKGERYSASCNDLPRVYVGRDYELDEEENHRRAARRLLTKVGWSKLGLVGGNTKAGMAWVFCAGSDTI